MQVKVRYALNIEFLLTCVDTTGINGWAMVNGPYGTNAAATEKLADPSKAPRRSKLTN